MVNRLAARDDVSKIVVVDSRSHHHSNFGQYVLRATPKVDLHIADIADEGCIFELICNCDLVYHLAAETHVQRSITEPRPFMLSNVMGTFAVLEAVRHHGCRLIHASTSEVYGDVPEARIAEDHPLDAYSPYAATKLAADSLVQAYVRTYGIDASVLRMFNAYGPGQHFEKVIPMFICSALCGLPLPIQGDGSATRDWNHVEDVAARLEQLIRLRLPTVVCNLASGEQMSVRELAERISHLAGRGSHTSTHCDERPGHVHHQAADAGKANKYFAPPRISLDEGLIETYQWYSDRMDLWRPMFMSSRPAIISEMKVSETMTRESVVAK